VVYALLAMLCYAGFIYFNRSLPAQIDAMVGAFWQLSTGAFAVFTVCLFRDISWSLSAEQWGLMLATGFLPGFVALFAAVLALKHLSTSVYGTIAYLEPVTVAFFGWLFFTEILSATQLIGGGLIIAAGILQTVFHRPAAAVG
jgi:drug/metabolite transporter (DMT)-like permease